MFRRISMIAERLLDDIAYRNHASLLISFSINLLYIVMKLSSGIYYRSTWFIAVAVYYILLALMRFMLLRTDRIRTNVDYMVTEWRRYRSCGIMFLLLTQALAGIVTFIVLENKGYDYPGMLIYAMAVYSFYAVTVAVINLVRYRKHGSPVISAAKAINFVAALVSLLSLETALLNQFGDGDVMFGRTVTALTGGGVCAVTFVMAVYMIVRSTRNLAALREMIDFRDKQSAGKA